MTSWQNFTEENVSQAPNVEGVYILGDSNKNEIYVGRSSELRERLASHLSTDDSCIKEARYFQYEVTTDSEDLETTLIGIYKPRCNG